MIKYFPDGSGVLIADSGARQAFRAGISPKDLQAMLIRFLASHAQATAPVTVVIDMNTVTNLAALVDLVKANAAATQADLDAAKAFAVNIRADLTAAQNAVQTINGRITTIQADIAAIKVKICL